jgi:uncharacterized membrane protein YfcA
MSDLGQPAMLMPEIAMENFWLLVIAAVGIGVTKSGFSGVSLVHVLIFAHVFGARASTGIVLPMLIAGDAMAMGMVGKHANWGYIRKMMPPALAGVVLAWSFMQTMDEAAYRPLIGLIILSLATMQILRMVRESWFSAVPHALWFSWFMGVLVGVSTMLANAAGPVFGLFLLAIGLPKKEFVATAAGFFLWLNVAKIPFSWNLGLIRADTLMVNLLLLPMIAIGLLIGRAVLYRIPQRTFDLVILAFSAIAAVQMLIR